jgi:hypothetical protein
MNFLKKSHLALGIILCGFIGIMAEVYPGNSSSVLEDTITTQDVRILDRRISLLEQRLYSIESSISRLQQPALSQRESIPQPVRDPEISLIRGDIQSLQLRYSELECGLIKLDERTTATVRDTRKRSGAKPTDPCRLNPEAPLRLSTRP